MGNTQQRLDSQGGRKWKIYSSDSTAKEGGRGKYKVVARQARREDMGNNQQVADSQGGRKFKIVSRALTLKEGGYGKYSVAARQPRREDIGNTQQRLDSQGGRTWEVLRSCQTVQEGGHGKYSLVRQIVWLALELGIFPYDLKRHQLKENSEFLTSGSYSCITVGIS